MSYPTLRHPNKTMPPVLRPAERSDYNRLYSLVNSLAHLHRHLDWRDALEWLGRQPFWLLSEQSEINGALACVPEPEEVAWVRLFAASNRTSPDYVWQKLFEQTLADLRPVPSHPTIATLALRDWYEELLLRNGFEHYQDIVVFLFEQAPPPAPRLDPAYHIRAMTDDDLEPVTLLDHLAFEPIWRLSPGDMRFAAEKSAYCTVIEREDGQVIAYQMSSSTGVHAHLARLAVHPSLQGQRLGFALLQNLLEHFMSTLGYWGVTLNTQHNNQSSLALYRKIGFRETGERFPVFVYPY